MSVYSRDFWAFGYTQPDYGGNISQDSSGYLYLPMSNNNSSGFTVSGAFVKTGIQSDTYLIKFDVLGNPVGGQYIPFIGTYVDTFSYVDNLNNSYLMGYVTTSGFNISGFNITKPSGTTSSYFIKYNASGSSQLAKIIDGISATTLSLTTDSINNVYFATQINTCGFSVSGFGSFNKTNTLIQSLIVKYDSSGNPLWSTFLGSDVGNISGASAIFKLAIDSSDNLYALGRIGSSVSGRITISGFSPIIHPDSSLSAIILKYTNSGTPLWATAFGGGNTDTITDGITDASGNLYVTGLTFSSGFTVSGLPPFNKVNTTSDAFMVKYNSSGTPLFGTIIGGSGAESGKNIQVDAKNNIYVYGTTNTSGFTISGLPDFGKTDSNLDGFIVKYNSSGIPKWGTLLNASGNYTPGNMILNGNKVIAGGTAQAHRLFYRNIDIAPTSSYLPILFKTNANGLPLMSKAFGTTIGGNWTWTGIKSDTSGSIFAEFRTTTSGFTISGFSPKVGTYFTDNIVKLNSSGIPIGVAYIDYYSGNALTTDVSNNVLSAGFTGVSGFSVSGLPSFNKTNTQQNGVFLKYNNSLNPLWGVIIGVSGGTSATGCTSDSSGNIYIVGETNQSGFSVSGFGSFNKTNTTNTGFLLKYSPSGIPLWGELVSNQGSYTHIITSDSSGFLYVAGYTSVSGFTVSGLSLSPNQKTNGDLFMIKYDSSGIPIWQTFPAGSGGSPIPTTIAVANNYVSVGVTISQSGYTISGWINKVNSNNGIAEVRFSKDGTLIYAKYVADTTVSGGGSPASVMITSQDESIVGSYADRSTFTICGMPNMRRDTSSAFKSFIAKYDSSGNDIFGRLYTPAGGTSFYFWMNNFTLGNDNSILGLGFTSSGNHYGYTDNDIYVATYTPQATAPEAPSAVSVLSHSNGVASIGWTDGEDGLSPITSYTITGNPGGSSVVATNPGTISGLVDGITYTFRVQATNVIGTSVASTVSATSTSPSASLSAVQNVSTNPTGITDYMATQTSKPTDILALEMRATIKGAGLSAADSIAATLQYIKGMRTKIGGGVVSTAALDTSDFGTFVATLTSSTMTARPIDVLYPDYGSGTTGTISLQYAATDNSKYYVIESPTGYSVNIVAAGKIVNLRINATTVVSDGITYGLGDTIKIGTKSLLLTGFGSLAYAVQNVGAGSSDPYITTIDGLHYKLPTMNGPIRFYQGPVDDGILTVNASLRVIPNSDLQKYNLQSFINYKNMLSNSASSAIHKQLFKNTQLTFFENVYIKYKDQHITLNIWDSEIRVVNHKGAIPCKIETAKIENESSIYKDYKGKTLRLRFGSSTVNISVYESPLIRNGISINASNMKAGNGIIVNATSSDKIKLPSLISEQATASKGESGNSKTTLQKEFFVDNGGLREKHIVVLK